MAALCPDKTAMAKGDVDERSKTGAIFFQKIWIYLFYKFDCRNFYRVIYEVNRTFKRMIEFGFLQTSDSLGEEYIQIGNKLKFM